MENWVRRRRIELGYPSQEDLAAAFQREGYNITSGAISHWENDRYNLPLYNEDFRRVFPKVMKMSIRDILVNEGFDIDVDDNAAVNRGAYILSRLPEDYRHLGLSILELLWAREKVKSESGE